MVVMMGGRRACALGALPADAPGQLDVFGLWGVYVCVCCVGGGWDVRLC